MVKKIAKTKTLTMRLNTVAKVRTVDNLMAFINENTATGALLRAAEDYILVCQERDRLKLKVTKLEFKHADLVDDIRQGLDAYNRMILAIGSK